LLFLVCFSLICSPAGAQTPARLKGFVVNVTRDCLLVVSIEHRAEIVTLAGVTYANSERQEHPEASDFIRSLVQNKVVEIQCLGRDQWGAVLGRIYLGDICLNEALVRAGLGKRIAPDRSQAFTAGIAK
jgi:hypothetical protein